MSALIAQQSTTIGPVARAGLLVATVVLAIAIGWLAGQDAWCLQVLIFLGSVVVALISPLLAICLLGVSFTLEVFTLGAGGQTVARVSGLGVGAVLVPQAVAAWVRRAHGRPVVSVAGLFLAGFLGLAFYSGIFADDRGAWLTGVWALLVRAGLLACIVHYIRTAEQHRVVLGAVVAMLAVAALAGTAEWIWGVRLGGRVFRAESEIGAIRTSGLFGSPALLAFALMTGIGSAAYLALHARPLARLGGLLAVPLLLFCLTTTMVRSAALGLLVFIGVLFALPPALPRWSKISIVLFVVGAILAAPAPVKTRFASPSFLMTERSIRNRVPMATAALHMTAANPLGVGLRNFERHYDQYKRVTDLQSRRAGHNMYLELAATTGIPGALCFLGWIGATLLALNDARRLLLGRRAQREAALTAFLLGIVAAMLFDGLFHTSPYQDKLFWLFMGLGLSAAFHIPRSMESSPRDTTRGHEVVAESTWSDVAPAPCTQR